MKEKALAKLEEEFDKGAYGRAAEIMKQSVRDALETFVRQDAEFAQAVVQGGSFADCMDAVAKGVGSGISDLEAYRRAVQFYFPGANVEFSMGIRVNPYEAADSGSAEPVNGGGITLSFDELFNG